MLFFWYASLLTSIITLAFGIFKRSWGFMLISTLTSIPIAYYFLGANNTVKYVGVTPVVLLLMTLVIWFMERKTETI